METSKALKQRSNLWYVGHGFALNFWRFGAELWVLGPLTLLLVHPDSVLKVDLNMNFLHKAVSLRRGSVSLLKSHRWDSSFPERTLSHSGKIHLTSRMYTCNVYSHMSTFMHTCAYTWYPHTHGVCISMSFKKDVLGTLHFRNDMSLLVMQFLWMGNALFS